MCANMLVKTLSNPYKGHHDMFNTDSVIAWGERTCFANLRSKFVGTHGDKKTPKANHATPPKPIEKMADIELSERPQALPDVPEKPSRAASDASGGEAEAWGALGNVVLALQPAALSPVLEPATLSPVIVPASPHAAERSGAMLHTSLPNVRHLRAAHRMSRGLLFDDALDS
jgi:hypothetical protein